MDKLPEATTPFIGITQDPASLTLDSPNMRRLEHLTVLKYSKNCAAQSVNEARKLMFTRGSIPPTKNALFQHAKQALHTAGFVQKQYSPSREYQISQIPVTGAGNGMLEPTSGCHIGRICHTLARLARCCSNACALWPVGVTASAIELVSYAVHCASLKGAALTMQTSKWKPNQFVVLSWNHALIASYEREVLTLPSVLLYSFVIVLYNVYIQGCWHWWGKLSA